MPYIVKRITGLTPSQKREVVFLTGEAEELDADAVFSAMQDNTSQKRNVYSRFDYWIAFGKKDEWFHGWPNNPEFKHCFVFKWKLKGVGQRFYGFLYHPQPMSRAPFQLCVLHTYDTKTEAKTEPRHLRLANRLRADQVVKAAIQMHFPDQMPGEKKWTN